MKVKFANKIYEVLYTMKVLGKPIYAVEDEPNHIDWLVNVEVIDEEEESEDEQIRKEDEDVRKWLISQLEIKSDVNNSCELELMILKSIAWLEKQAEQKFSWSEEDEKKRILLMKILEVNHPHGLFKVNSSETMRTEELVSWLKSLNYKI